MVGVTVGFFAAVEAVGTTHHRGHLSHPEIALLPLLILWLGSESRPKIA